MEIEFYIDLETGEPHIWSHNVTEGEIIEVFDSLPLILHASRGAYMALGQTRSGRYL